MPQAMILKSNLHQVLVSRVAILLNRKGHVRQAPRLWLRRGRFCCEAISPVTSAVRHSMSNARNVSPAFHSRSADKNPITGPREYIAFLPFCLCLGDELCHVLTAKPSKARLINNASLPMQLFFASSPITTQPIKNFSQFHTLCLVLESWKGINIFDKTISEQ